MSSIVRKKVGVKIYLYEPHSYRNEEDKSRNKRLPIGSLDLNNGNYIYKPKYLVHMVEQILPINIPTASLALSVKDIRCFPPIKKRYNPLLALTNLCRYNLDRDFRIYL